MDILQLTRVSRSYGGLAANREITFSLRKGEITSIIGPNGAGKTTLFNVISGVEFPDQGTIKFEGRDITRLGAPEITRLGLVRTFQQVKIFRDIPVRDAVMIGRHIHDGTSLLQALFAGGKARRARQDSCCKADEILQFLGISAHAGTLARHLSYGDQKLVGIATALAAEPRLLLLDEPAAGMNPQESRRLMETIRKVREMGITVGLVEHNMKLVMNISDRVLVLNYGELIMDGTPEEVRKDQQVIQAYLGKAAHA